MTAEQYVTYQNIATWTGLALLALAPAIKEQLKTCGISKRFTVKAYRKKELSDLCLSILELTEANRVAIIDYSNGNSSINGLPFDFADMTEEVTDVATKSLQKEFQRVPLSFVIPMVIAIDQSTGKYARVGKDFPDKQSYRIQQGYGVNTCYFFKLGNSLADGALTIAWTQDDHVMSAEQIEKVYVRIQQINKVRRKISHFNLKHLFT